ncbi:long-chain fatty acid transport protein 2-like [Conger conger]|uniref:long-chain fatty acid transport protein 2-like n=1 Tax=Conger conger TaxID=82655 RepID=UPI002A5A09DC|nr:long-chain fatty acid transport protein 2-like [Conger conger]
MEALHMHLAALAIISLLIVLFKYRFPYFVKDVLYTFRIARISWRMRHILNKRPLYTILDCFLEAAKKNPNKTFIVFEGKTFSYSEADKWSNKVGRSLWNHAPVTEGDTVALFLGNEPSYLLIWLGLAKIGCAAALLNYNVRSKSLLHCFSCCGANVLIVAAELKDAVEEVLPTLREQNISVFLLAEECDTEGMESLADKIEEASDEPLSSALRANVTIGSPALYIYTSGTTGLPKAAVITQQRLWGASSLQTVGGVTAEDVVYITLPLYHTSGFVVGFTGAIGSGATIVLRRKFSASQFWDDCRKYNVTVILYIGELMRYLCSTSKRDDERDHRVRLAIGNGVRADVWKEFLNRFGSISVLEIYGSTEGNISFINYTGKVGAIGRVNFLHKKAFPYALIKYDTLREEPVRDHRGLCIEAAKGEAGLLVSKITKKAPFLGYMGSLQLTEKKRLRDVFEKGDLYFNSGDLLRIDQHNFIYFHDRVGDTFRWKGENVATTEVSDVFAMVDCIQEANVYGVRVPGHEGRIGMAAVTLKEGAEFDPASVFSQVSGLPAYAQPRFIRIQDSLEMTGTFKQIKVKLVDEGFCPSAVPDPLYFLDDKEKSYVPMTQEIYHAIESGSIKL